MISRSFFLLINAGILAHVKKMKPDLDVLFFFPTSLPEQHLLGWCLRAWVSAVRHRGWARDSTQEKAVPESTQTVQKRHRSEEASKGRSRCEAAGLKAGVKGVVMGTGQHLEGTPESLEHDNQEVFWEPSGAARTPCCPRDGGPRFGKQFFFAWQFVFGSRPT